MPKESSYRYINLELWNLCNQRWSASKLSPRKKLHCEGSHHDQTLWTFLSLSNGDYFIQPKLAGLGLSAPSLHYCLLPGLSLSKEQGQLGNLTFRKPGRKISSEMTKGQEKLQIPPGFKNWPVSKGKCFHCHARNAAADLPLSAWMSLSLLGMKAV